MNRAEERLRLLRENQRIRGKIAQLFRDARHWNATHPEHEPIDPDPDGELARQLRWLEQAEAELASIDSD